MSKIILPTKGMRVERENQTKKIIFFQDEDRRRNLGFSSKGYIYTLEVMIAISIILISAAFIFGKPPVKPEMELSIIKQQGFNAIEYLDQKDLLRQLNDAELENQLSSLLSSNIKLRVNNNTGLPNQTVIAVDYYISGYKGTYLGKRIRLFLWEEI
ncbi:MAG: hypothetical protein NT129_02975 [Candidatus Aenigmarchaeota archaeon]|nr:hypothetical protein [Candidatus Aenigmarchaeota archaeon]